MSRQERLATQIQESVAKIIHQCINHPDIGFVSFTKVKLSTDYRIAWVSYSQIGSDNEKEKTFKALKKARKVIRFELGKALNLKRTPELRFQYDSSLEKGTTVIQKLKEIAVDDVEGAVVSDPSEKVSPTV